MTVRLRAAGIALGLALLVVALDQYVKGLVAKAVPLGESLPVFPGFFALHHTRNTGAAFSLFATAPMSVLIGVSLLVIVIFLALVWPHLTSRVGVVITALVVGGAVGNLLDRILLGGVRDYAQLQFITWPIFNLADACVVVGVGLLVIRLLRAERQIAAPVTEPVPTTEKS